MPEFKGLATGIGSLPYINSDKALELIFKYVAQIPFWPQLPKRDVAEGMLAQFSEHIPCLKLTSEGLVFRPVNQDKELEIFYDRLIAQDFEYFKISPDYAQGLWRFYEKLQQIDLSQIKAIKCQVTGPFTFAASLNDSEGNSLLNNEVFLQVIIKAMAMKALWQVNLFKKFAKKIIVFIDEPFLSSFGSAYTPLNREQVIQGLGEVASILKAADALAGVHCCGNTDWSIFTDCAGIDIINFDLNFFERLALYGRNLKGFLQRGGYLCWGAVATQEPNLPQNADTLIKKIEQAMDLLIKKGISRQVLENQLLLSPACGLGSLSEDKPEKIFSILAEISRKIR